MTSVLEESGEDPLVRSQAPMSETKAAGLFGCMSGSVKVLDDPIVPIDETWDAGIE